MNANQNISNQIQDILNKELECFNNLLDQSQELIENSESVSLDSVRNLLKARKHWIEILQKLEGKKKNFIINNNQFDKVIKEISQIARTLVAIDAKILDILHMKRLELVKDFSNITDNKIRNSKFCSLNQENAKIIDIIQE